MDRGKLSATRIEFEQGRFVVYLDLIFVDRAGRLQSAEAKRINDYPTRAKAEIAARWIERAATRHRP